MSYQTNFDSLDVDQIIANSRKTRMGLEGGATTQSYTQKVDYDYKPSSYQTNEYVIPSNYITSEVQREYVPINYETKVQSETVKRGGLGDSSYNKTVTYVNNGPAGSVDGRLAIIMLGTEIERLLELGRECEYKYNQFNIEITTLREQLSIKERMLIEVRSQGGDNSEYYRQIEHLEREIQLLKNNAATETVVSPETENYRKRLKNIDFENQDLKRKYDALQIECNKLMAELGKGRQARANQSSKKHATAWCC